uniref:RRM domain-containing protein n=1 Tax=Octopus bimaculoides TaxID=37653 RepID=A0A0L8FK40_OCTBM
MTGNYCDDDPNAEKFRKLFIGGLNNETTEDTLRQYFETWGEVVDCVVMKNPTNNRSRGFGFVTYQSAAQLDKAQAQRPHTLDKKTLDTKRAMPRDGSEETQASVKKMFVGGLEETTSEEEIRELFCPYGRIEKVEMIKDKATGKQKRFCFVTFDDFDCVDKCVIRKRFPLGDKSIEVKKAVSKTEMGGRGGAGGRSGGRGGGGGGGGYSSNWGSNQGNYNNGGGYYQGSDGRYGGHGYNNGYGSSFGSNYGNGSFGGAQRQGNFSHRNTGGPYGRGYGRGGGGSSMGGYRR